MFPMPIFLFIIISANDCDLRYKRTVNIKFLCIILFEKYENMVCLGFYKFEQDSNQDGQSTSDMGGHKPT